MQPLLIPNVPSLLAYGFLFAFAGMFALLLVAKLGECAALHRRDGLCLPAGDEVLRDVCEQRRAWIVGVVRLLLGVLT